MAQAFNRNMFIMLFAIMIGAVIITYFVADIQSNTKIEEIQIEHETQIVDINAQNENFTDNFLQGSITLDSARETREVANYHFDFALFWYQRTVTTNASENYTTQCIDNATNALSYYLETHDKFNASKPYFIIAADYTQKAKYLEVISYYIKFADAGQNLTMLRYEGTQLLIAAAENYSAGDFLNATLLFENFTALEETYMNTMLPSFELFQDQIDNFIFFNEIREEQEEETETP